MDLKEAEELRCVRFYEWALETMRHEVQNDFPLLGKIRSLLVFGILLQIRDYPPEELEEVCLLAIKRTHPRALEILGEQLTAEEENFVCQRWKPIWQDRLPFNTLEFERQFLELAPGQMGMSRQFRAQVTKNLSAYLKLKPEKLSGSEFMFQDTIGDWNVETRCQARGTGWKYFGYRHYIFRKDHTNAPEFGHRRNMNFTRIVNNGITGVAKLLAISGGTGWSETHGEQEETVLDEIMIVFDSFYGQLPTLLQGLDIDS